MKKLPNWIAPVLRGAGILNFLLAAGLVFFSDPILAVIDITSNSSLWLQVAGIGFAVLGLGYLIASYNPVRNTLALFMGMMANGAGILFLPVHFGSMIFTNWLLGLTVLAMVTWVAILIMMLVGISRHRQEPKTLSHSYSEPLSKTLNRFRTHKGKNLLKLSNEQPILLIFLHRFGGGLCRQALAEIKNKQTQIENEGTRLLFVHLGSEEKAASLFEKAGLGGEHRICDPNGIMYEAFELDKAVYEQPAHKISWMQVRASFMSRKQGGNFPLPGVFLINRGEIIKSYRQKQASGSPDFVSLARLEAA